MQQRDGTGSSREDTERRGEVEFERLERRVLRYIIAIVLLCQLLWSYLPVEIDSMIKKLGIKPSNLSIYIADSKTQKVLASFRESASMRPASVIKLATTYASLLEMGPDFRWPTQFFYTGSYENGKIGGDLIVKAYGDPTLSCRDIPSIVDRLVSLGVKGIDGDIVIDRSFFSVDGRIASGFDSNRYSEYNAMPDALMFDDHLCKIIVDPRSGKASVSKAIDVPDYRVVNRIKVTNKRCTSRYSWPMVRIREENGIPTVFLSGTLSKRCSPRHIGKVLSRTYAEFFQALKSEFVKKGVKFDGGMRLENLSPDARLLMTHYARPLIDIVAKTNKKSNNLYARHIFLLVGARVLGSPATVEKGRIAVHSIFEKRGIFGPETILDNGCGLSRTARTTASSLYLLLQDAYRNFGDRWMKALSIAGRDGTIRRRFRNSVVRGKAWMKTGTLKDAKNIAGYVKGGSGRLYTVVILYNGNRKWLASTLQNRIITWLVKKR
jgi:D-alanyl-D-alanine carboxypeptidase/D-alanyl-D-alanine-endopeptidase (penicillin-binding protein 4)